MNLRRLLPQSNLMPDVDFAVAGTDLFSALLAGSLASQHGKKVVRVGRRPSAQRLWRTLPLALPFATRPAGWALLGRSVAEMRDLLASFGAESSLGGVEVGIETDLPQTGAALDHLVHVAAANGHQVGRLSGGWAIRRVALLDTDMLQSHTDEWLRSLGVENIEDRPVDAGFTVLADDASILDLLAQDNRPDSLASESMLSTLIVSPRPLAAPVQHYIDRGVTLIARPGRTVLALVSGECETEARLSSTLPGPFPMKRLATTRFRRFVTRDGAPLIGRIKGTRQIIVAGLGSCTPFMAPAMARFLAGASTGEEKSWFTAHDLSRPRDVVADFARPMEGATI